MKEVAILKCGIRSTLAMMNRNKTEGPDGIIIERLSHEMIWGSARLLK